MDIKNKNKLVDKVIGIVQKLIPTVDTPSTEIEPHSLSVLMPTTTKQLPSPGSVILQQDQSRQAYYIQFDYLDNNLAEAKAALDIYADNIVAGTVGGEETFYLMIDEDFPKLDEVNEKISMAEKKLGIKISIWDIARDMVKYGDAFREVVIEEIDGELWVTKLKPLEPGQIYANVDSRGVFLDKKLPYFQLVPGAKEPIKFDWWRIMHCKYGTAPYGYKYSLFYGAPLRAGRHLVWVDEALVLARLSRAWQRNAYLIDTGKLSPDEAISFVEKFMDRLKTKEVISNTTTGQTVLLDAPLLPDEDVGIPVGEGAKADVKQLAGDSNVTNIRDVEYLREKFITGISLPKAYLSLEADTRAKATLDKIDAQFARQVRRRQLALVEGLTKLYTVMFTLIGLDPESFEWSIEFPELVAEDEMAKWELMQIKANVAKTLAVDVGLLNDYYIYKEILGLDDTDIREYGLQPSETVPQINITKEMLTDPELLVLIDDLKDIFNFRLEAKKRKKGKVKIC